MTNLPIDVVPDTCPRLFRWSQVINDMEGRSRRIEQTGPLPSSVELAVESLVVLTKRTLEENAVLRGQVNGMTERIAAQSELLSKKAETKTTAKGK